MSARVAPDCRSRSANDSRSSSSSSASNPSVCARTNASVDRSVAGHHLEHPVDEREVAADVHREELVGHVRAEHRALDVARNPVAVEPGLAQRVDDRDLRAVLAREVEVLHEHRLRVGDVGAEQHDEVALDHVGVGARGRGDADRLLQRRRRRRVAHACRVVDVVGTEEPRELLRDVVRLVGDAPRGEVARASRSGVVARMRSATRSSASSHDTRVKPRSPRRRTIGWASRPRSRSSRPGSVRSGDDVGQPIGVERPHRVDPQQVEPRGAEVHARRASSRGTPPRRARSRRTRPG